MDSPVKTRLPPCESPGACGAYLATQDGNPAHARRACHDVVCSRGVGYGTVCSRVAMLLDRNHRGRESGKMWWWWLGWGWFGGGGWGSVGGRARARQGNTTATVAWGGRPCARTRAPSALVAEGGARTHAAAAGMDGTRAPRSGVDGARTLWRRTRCWANRCRCGRGGAQSSSLNAHHQTHTTRPARGGVCGCWIHCAKPAEVLMGRGRGCGRGGAHTHTHTYKHARTHKYTQSRATRHCTRVVLLRHGPARDGVHT